MLTLENLAILYGRKPLQAEGCHFSTSAFNGSYEIDGEICQTQDSMKLFHSKKDTIVFSIDVACAIIHQSGKILITRRRERDHLGGLWEFPGGKRIAPESLGFCLEREIWEELQIRVRPLRFLRKIDYQYPEKGVSLYFYECELLEGRPWPHHSQEIRWVWPFELRRYEFPPADEAMLNDLAYSK